MSPAPSRTHQGVSGNLHGQLFNFLKGKFCKVYAAPFDVRLDADKEDDTVVQPDITVVCDKSKLDDKGCKGAPDMVIEIISASSARMDRLIKLRLYRRAGVREYWIIDPETKTAQVYLLENGKYVVNAYDNTDAVPVHVLEGCTINLKEVFEEE
jgi:Uma2 family endonuclease